MNPFKILKKKKLDGNYVLALDIGTAFIKALIFRIDREAGKGYVEGVGRQEQTWGHMQAGAVTDIAGVVRSCQQAIQQAVARARIKPTQAIIGIAGELVKGTTTTVRYERLKPKTKINLAELRNILHKVQWKAFDRVRRQLAWETGYNEIDVKLINAAIVDVKIDGYHISNPIGFQGKDVTITIFNSYAPLVHLGAVQTIAEELDLDLLSIAAEPYAVARSVAGDGAEEFSAIFIDVGGGTTDVAVVRKGGIEGTKMFALGGRAFTKRLAEVLGQNLPKAEEVKLQYSNGRLRRDRIFKVRQALEQDSKIWLAGVELTLGEFSSNSDLLPGRILLCGGGSLLPEIKAVLLSEAWISKLPFGRLPDVSYLKPDDVVNIIDLTASLVDPSDVTPMALANLALELAGEEGMIGGIMRKVVRMIQT